MPPLGTDLFTELERLGGSAAQLPEDLKEIFRENFEAGMASFFTRYNRNTSSFQRDMAEYLSTFKPSVFSGYLALVELFALRDVTFVSLNYDLMLERAALAIGCKVGYTATKVPGVVNVLKIHGSSNFWPNFQGVKISDSKFTGAIVDIDAEVEFISPANIEAKFAEQCGHAPSIAMFAVGKNVRVCPDAIRRQQKEWEGQLLKSDILNIIGVAVHEVDEHIWGLIGRFGGRINYFGFDGDRQAYENWNSRYPRIDAAFHNMGFNGALKFLLSQILEGKM